MLSGPLTRLRERGVLRVAASYAVIAWLVLQIADVALEPWDVADWVRRAPLVIALLGFPVAIALAWFLELSEGGVARDSERIGVVRPATRGWHRYADVTVISVLAAVVGFFLMRDAGWLGDSMRPRPGVESASLAVLPFANVGSPEQAYLSEGLSDELRDQFSRLQSLSVTARSSSTAFIGQSLDATTIAGKLAVGALLEGTVGRESGRVRVSVQLVNGRTGKVQWAERYDRPDRDLLAVQAEIGQAVVAAVLPRFAASGKKAPPPPTSDPVAYDLYLLGRQKMREIFYDLDADGVQLAKQAEALFRSAIAADPEFAQAHAALARALFEQMVTKAELAAAEPSILELVERALELDPKLSEPYLIKGLLLRDMDRPGMGDYFGRAVELDPSNTVALLALSQTLRTEGRFDESYRMIRRARNLDPMDRTSHGRALWAAAWLGRRDEVLSVVERMQQVFPGDNRATGATCTAWRLFGDYDEAAACSIKGRSEYADDAGFLAQAGVAFVYMGEDALALRYLDQAAAAGIEPAAQAAMALRHDRRALQRLARELLERDLTLFDCHVGQELVVAGMPEEALEIFRRCGLAEVAKTESSEVAEGMYGLATMIALLQMQGEVEEAEQLLPQLTAFTEKIAAHGANFAWWRVLQARALALSGRSDAALERLGLAVDSMGMPWPAEALEDDPVFRELRMDPRFQAHIERMRGRQAEIRARLPKTFQRYGLAWPPDPATP